MKVKKIDINWHPDLSIYASETHLKSVSDEYGWIGGFDDMGNLRCILPYTVIHKAGIFRLIRFRVETILLEDSLEIEDEKSFLNSVIEYFRAFKADMIIPATTNAIFRTYPDGAIAAPYGTYIIDLRQTEDMIWNNIKKTNRKKITGAINKGVEIREGIEYTDAAYDLVRNTFRRSKMDFMSHKDFKRFVTSLGENVKVFVASYQGNIQGCSVMPFSRHSAYALYGGRTQETVTGAMNLLKWETIKFFHHLGVKTFDFVGVRINPEKGSKQEGLDTFKQSFGSKLVQGYMWKYSLSPIKFAIYNIAVRRLRGGDIVDQECRKLRKNY